MRETWILSLVLIAVSISFMSVSVYLMLDNRILASLLSLAIGVLVLSSGLGVLRSYNTCRG